MNNQHRSPIDHLIDQQVKFVPIEGEPPTDGTPYATHRGVLRVGDAELRVYQLNTGQRVIDADDVHRFFGFQEAGDE